jgi:hypothetical protein
MCWPGGRQRPRPDIDKSLIDPSEATKEEKLATGFSEGGNRIEFVTGPSLAREDVENRTEKADLMAEPENLPSPSSPDPNTSPRNFLLGLPMSLPRGNHYRVDGHPETNQ